MTAPPTTINGRYRIDRELGRGGIGVVYLAHDQRLHDMPVVIKFLLDDSTGNPWIARKFLQEAEALTRIHHPGVVRVIDRDQTAEGRPFFVMEFVKGVSLRSVIQTTGIDLEFAAAIVRDVGQALSAAHQEGVLHRDLKPENIMLETLSTGAQHAKLIDFGIAKVQDSQESAHTQAGTLAGSLHYMAPEQLLGQPASAASDLYAFATVAYELLTGRRPFNPDSRNHIAAIPQLMTMQREERIVPPQQLRPGVSAAAQAIVLRGLAFDPAARAADVRQFGDDLAQALLAAAGEPIGTAVTLRPSVAIPESATRPAPTRLDDPPTRPVPGEAPSPPVAPLPAPPPPAPPPPARRRAWPLVAVAATVGLAVVLGLVYLATIWSSPDPSTALQEQATPGRSQAASPAAEVRTLTYSLTLQRGGRPPQQLARKEIFTEGDRVRLEFTSPQDGHLYIFNEGPLAGTRRDVNVLFPSARNGGSARIAGRQPVTTGEFVFDKEQGVEKLWIVWSRDAQPRLDEMGKRWANEEHRGAIGDLGDLADLDTFLRDHESPMPDVTVDEAAKTTTLSAPANVFVRQLTIEHQ